MAREKENKIKSIEIVYDITLLESFTTLKFDARFMTKFDWRKEEQDGNKFIEIWMPSCLNSVDNVFGTFIWLYIKVTRAHVFVVIGFINKTIVQKQRRWWKLGRLGGKRRDSPIQKCFALQVWLK